MIVALGINQMGEDALRTPSREYVWGCLGRSRLFCKACGIASDTLFTHNVIKLDLQRKGPDTLQNLLVRHLSQQAAAAEDRCPDQCGNQGRLSKQIFLEREPPVLFFQLRRGREEHVIDKGRVEARTWKISEPVAFPQRLAMFRSGPCTFAGAVRHVGKSILEGHYVANVWQGGDVFAEYDDYNCRTMSWEQVASGKALTEAYLLAYVRQDFWEVRAHNGTLTTPYRRDSASEGMFAASGSSMLRAGTDSGAVPVTGAASSRDSAGGKRARDANTPARGLSSVGTGSGVLPSPGSARLRPVKKFKCIQCQTVVENKPADGAASPILASPPRKCARCDLAFGTDSDAALAAAPDLPVPPFPSFGRHGQGSGRERGVDKAASAGARSWECLTPSAVQVDCCLARIWDEGRGAQFPVRPQGDGVMCGRHSKVGSRYGLITGPMPADMLQEFLRAADSTRPASSSQPVGQGTSNGSSATETQPLPDATRRRSARMPGRVSASVMNDPTTAVAAKTSLTDDADPAGATRLRQSARIRARQDRR